MAKRTKTRMQQAKLLELEHDPFADEFFQRAPDTAPEPWEDDEHTAHPPIARDKRRAMIATFAIFGVFATATAGFLIYSKLLMPTPVTLGAAPAQLTLPQPIAPAAFSAPAATVVPVIAPPPASEAPATAATAPTQAVEPPTAVATTAPAAPPAQVATEPSAEATSAPRVADKPTARVSNPHRATARPAATPSSSASAEAMRELNAGHASQARQLAARATAQNPQDANAWIVLGAASDALGDHAAAVAAYKACVARAAGPRVSTCKALAR